MPDEINKIIKAATKGGEVLLKYFGQDLEVKQKSVPADFVTNADLESEDIIIKTLGKNFPDYNIQSEETGLINKNSEYTFIVDPLDGSYNYVLGITYFSVSIALMKNNETIIGVVHNPIGNNTYTAIRGKSAYLGSKKLQVNKENKINRASVSLVCNYKNYKDDTIKFTNKLYNGISIKRMLVNASCALDLCLLAEGSIEALINNNSQIHDFAAGKLIAREAEALITDFKGNKEKNDKNSIFLASNGTAIHKKILQIL